MVGRLIGINKHQGVHTVSVGETWQSMMVKWALALAGADSKDICVTEQMWIGMDAGIKGWINIMWLLWEQHFQKEDWLFSLIYTSNVFNEEKWMAMLWSVQFDWASGAWFTFNYYRRWSTLVIRYLSGMGHFLNIKEGYTQVYLLAMVSYGLGILPLIIELQS